MRTLRYNASTVDNGGVFETAVVDLFSGNMTTRRIENRLLLGRFARGPVSDLSIMSACNVIVVNGWSEADPDQVNQLAAIASTGTKVYIEASTSVEEALDFATQVGAYGVYSESLLDSQNKADIVEAGLKWGSSNQEAGVGCGLSCFTPDNIDDASALSAFVDLGAQYSASGQIKFYYNSDPNHLPGQTETTPNEIVIPFGTVVSAADGTKFFVVEEFNIQAGSNSANATFVALDSFDTIEKYGISEHSLDVDGLYVTNTKKIDHIHSVCMLTGHMSYVMGLASYATLFNVDASSEDSFYASEPPIFMGLEVTEVDFSDPIVVKTDTGTAFFDRSGIAPMDFRNELVSVMEHDAGGDFPVFYRTAATEAELDTFPYLPYSNDSMLDRFVQLSMSETGDTWIEVTLTDDGDTIDFIETDRMIDQLPLWMAWRDKGSTGFSMTNIVGRYANELFGASGIVDNYHLADLDDRMNGVARSYEIDPSYVSSFGDVSIDTSYFFGPYEQSADGFTLSPLSGVMWTTDEFAFDVTTGHFFASLGLQGQTYEPSFMECDVYVSPAGLQVIAAEVAWNEEYQSFQWIDGDTVFDQTLSEGDKIRISLAGSILTVYVNDVDILSYTMQTPPAGGKCRVENFDVENDIVFTGTGPMGLHPIPWAASEDELLSSRVPCAFVSDGRLYTVLTDRDVISTTVGAGAPSLVNLWTSFDEWGLLFNLKRHDGESLTRFRDRIVDVFASGFGSSKSGAMAAAERELSPVGMDTGAFLSEGKVSVFDLTDSSMTAPDGFPSEAKMQAVQEQRNAGVHTWDNAKAGKSIFDADGVNHKGQGRMPYIYDTPLDGLNLLSGVGPGDDLFIQRAEDVLISPTVGIKLEGSDYVDSYTGRRLQATVVFRATGTHRAVTTPSVRYKVRAHIQTLEGGQTKHYYRDFVGTSRSNVNPNATSRHIGYKNTNVARLSLIHRDRSGAIILPGTWVSTAGGSKPVYMPKTASITSITIENPDSNSSVAYWLEYTTAAHALSTTTPTSSSLTKSDVSTNSSVRLNVIVAPFDATTYSSKTWNSGKIASTVMLYNTLEGGELSNNAVVVKRPAFNIPPYITNVDYTATVISVVPVDNGSRLVEGEVDEGKISQTVLDDLKLGVTGSTATAWNDTNSAHTKFKRYFTVSFDPTKVPQASSFPYVRRQLAGVSATSSVIVPKLEDGETRIVHLQPAQIPVLPPTANASVMKVTTDYPNVSAKLTGNVLVVSRFDGKWYNNLYASHGYYWISGDEKYAYSYKDGAEVGPLAIAVVPDVETSTIQLSKRPANFSLTRVLVDGNEYSYRFYGDESGGKTFSVDGLPDFTESFYIDGVTIHLSEPVAAGSTVTIISEPVDASGVIDTGISVSPYASWDDRFFIVIDERTVEVNNLVIEADVQVVSSDRAAGGCLDIMLVSARVLDVEGNPIEGATVDWTASSGNIHVTQAVTGADGRSTAYYTPVNSGQMTITASSDGKSTTKTVVSSAASGSTRPLVVTADYQSMIMSGTEFNADIEIVSANPLSSVEYSLSFIPAEGTQNVEGSWTDITPATHVLAVLNGKTRYTQRLTSEGLYKMTIDRASLVWRVY